MKTTDVNSEFTSYLKSVVGRNKKMTQRELSNKIGYTEVTVSRYFKDTRTMPMDAILKMCKALDIDALKFVSFYQDYLKMDDTLSRIVNLSDENRAKLIEYMDFLQYEDDKKRTK